MKLNVEKVLAAEQQRLSKPTPLPKVKVYNKAAVVAKEDIVPTPVLTHEALPLLNELKAEFIKVKKDRAILSSQIWKKVEEIERVLRQEDPMKADAFMHGEIANEELTHLASQIESFTDRGAEIYDDIDYVERYGKLPERVQSISTSKLSEDAKAIHYEIRRLDDRIHKTQKKLNGKQPKNPARLAMWNEKVAYDEARRNDLKAKLKKLQYEARG